MDVCGHDEIAAFASKVRYLVVRRLDESQEPTVPYRQ
jgi:hypothetical protein